MVTKGIVLGHIISSQCMEVDKAKIDLVAKLPTPTTVKDVRSFLKGVAQRKRCVEANGPVEGATMGNFNFSIKRPYGDN